jgi:S1-C subfamily serine protease
MRTTLGLAVLLLLPGYSCNGARAAEESKPVAAARRTATVELIEHCLPSVVAIRAFAPTEKQNEERVNLGSGSIIHSAGFILTNFHVLQATTRGEVVLTGGETHAYRLIAGFAHEDLALIKIDTDGPMPALALGRSDDLLLGEPVLAIGSPAGLVSTVSEGIVSGLKRSTSTEFAFLPTMIQTSAAISGGSSGGPLINALGDQIGVITSRKEGAENIGFAIAIDRLREVLPRMLAAEQRCGFRLGLEVDMLAPVAKVVAVAPDSPAAAAGIAVGDVIESIEGVALRHGIDLHLALIACKPGQELALAVRRGAESSQRKATLAALPLAKPSPEAGLQPGLQFAGYQGLWKQVPDFAALKPVVSGIADKPAPGAYNSHPDQFALEFVGLVNVPADGLYTFFTRSDDGSRLLIDDRLLVDNDGLHPPREAAGLVRLAAGYHAVRLQYFEAGGDQVLQLSYEGPGLSKQEIPASAYRHQAKSEG